MAAPPPRTLQDALPALNALTARKAAGAATARPQMPAGGPAAGADASAAAGGLAGAAFEAVRDLALATQAQLREQPLHIANHRPQTLMTVGE